ncbi:hypothetical protein H8S95_03585 [Pontibacter sp. KCTC 32443]|uniref:hypothetical protein n=1 Tax=Pontibacter TaxID=323449 RepID=UPI00164EBA45|nr:MULTISPECIES: hypothetical protein [Pontibacter]MBC5773134.1 hypothetical protein [Pontibacter sp. KCTC 32443]
MSTFNHILKQLQELLGKVISYFKLGIVHDNEVAKQECESCDKLLNWRGAVQLVSFSEDYRRSLVSNRRIKHRRLKGRIFIQRSELLRWDKKWKDDLSGKEPFKENQI